jgi:hypothetical protein
MVVHSVVVPGTSTKFMSSMVNHSSNLNTISDKSEFIVRIHTSHIPY